MEQIAITTQYDIEEKKKIVKKIAGIEVEDKKAKKKEGVKKAA